MRKKLAQNALICQAKNEPKNDVSSFPKYYEL